MTSLRLTNAWLAASGLLALMTLSACPRGDFELGVDDAGRAQEEDAGTKTGNQNMEPSKDAGTDDQHQGDQAAKCGSRGLPECADNEFCSYPQSAGCGETDKAGVCKKKPDICTKIYKPVCGCDGKTYGNSCEADSAGVSARSDGECGDAGAPTQKVCGGFSGKQCDDGEYCNYPDGAMCGIADASGVCEKRPDDCKNAAADPVCGCNAVTYANACEANHKGFGVMNAGKCENQGQLCGYTISAACPDDSYCKFPEVGQCGEGPEFGNCEKKPDVCTDIYMPVCGCDSKTYGNSCQASVAGVSVQSDGECKADGGSQDGAVCGVRGAAQCADTEFCYFTLDSQCAAADVPGHCRKRPDVCNFIEKPVCGCDGKTHGNECIASQAGTGVASEGECAGMSEPAACGGLQGLQCAAGEYCKFTEDQQCGAADQMGQCSVITQACTREFHQVCGCDDKTYSNPCLAGAAGTSVAAEGACATTEPAACGGLQGAQCADKQFCKFAPADQCGAADQMGKCTDIPQVCTQEFHEVCGCDGVTYSNACAADTAGQSIVSDGKCPTTSPAACGGLQGLKCADKQFCNFPAAAQCGAADQLGECSDVPENCTLESKPVCGCDGKTYDNACIAKMASQSVVSEGACRQSSAEGGTCGGLAGVLCSGDLYCDFAPATKCGSGDQSGVCKTKPDVCTDQLKEVCGCDNKTYGNACNAQSAGVSVLHDGRC